jgi:hypothetical protein
VTVPLPTRHTVSVYRLAVKVAVTVVAEVMLTVHAPVPLQPPPLQPLKVEPPLGVAVSVTAVPWVKPAAHAVPQVMPPGADVTVPPPVPAVATDSV